MLNGFTNLKKWQQRLLAKGIRKLAHKSRGSRILRNLVTVRKGEKVQKLREKRGKLEILRVLEKKLANQYVINILRPLMV